MNPHTLPRSLAWARIRASGWPVLVAFVVSAGSNFLSGPPRTPAASSRFSVVRGQPDNCLTCHGAMTGFAPAHDSHAIGCAVCHLGDRLALDATRAHAGMTLTPGNLSVARQTCATAACHAAIGERVSGSLMNTMSGVVAVDHHVFGENPDRNRPFCVSQLGHSPADTHLRTLCASCHLGNDKLAPAPLDEDSRGGGCSACHLDYGPRAEEELARRGRPGLTPLSPQAHPMISLQVSDQACFGCHSRSGRISTNYEGWHETLLDEAVAHQIAGARAKFRVLVDGRVFEKMPADVHFTQGMSCTDCHLASEVMGDGQFHPHEENAVKIACIDCHSNRSVATRPFAELDAETQTIVALRGLIAPNRRYIVTQSGEATYPNVWVDSAGVTQLISQRSGQVLQPKPLSAACGRDSASHASLDCGACHSAWASQCVSCHTQAEPRLPGWDYLTGKPSAGSWREDPGRLFADLPTLGVVMETATASQAKHTRVTTVAPAMILTLNKSAVADHSPTEFHRLFAPISPHTTASRARDCQSCHASSSALGYGRGKLHYEVTGAGGRWQFTPELAPLPSDGLPADAWIGFLQSRKGEVSTRDNVRPFSIDEQRRVLRVGACLTCHAGDSPVMKRALVGFEAVLGRRRPQCVSPMWP
jgi:hypothetical protein